MTPVVQGYYYGYRGKQAASGDVLPTETAWNMLPGVAMETAGRGKALFEAQGKTPPFSVRHPVANLIGGIGAGAALGTAAGAAAGKAMVGIDNVYGMTTETAGTLGGAVVGGILGSVLALRRSLQHTKEESKSLEDQGITPEVSKKARRLLVEKSKKNILLHTLAGFFWTGRVMHGRTSQLRKLTGDTEESHSRLLSGLGSIPYADFATDPVQGYQSVSHARQSVG